MNDADLLELDALCQALEDGAISESQLGRLSELLRTSEEARAHYVRSMALAASLHHYAAEMQAEAPDAIAGRIIRPEWWKWGAGVLAAAAAVIFAIWLRPGDPVGPETLARDGDSSETVARITGAAEARWTGAQLALGDELRPAQRLELAAGAAEITFDSGAQLILEGPASLQLTSAWAASLARGTVRANVPPEAVGFRVTASAVEVTDLGTEFSLVADADTGAAEVFVHKGAVETTSPGSDRTPLVLREKQARRFARAGGSSEVRDPEAQLLRLTRRIAFQRAGRPPGTIAWNFDEEGDSATKAVLTGLPGATPVSIDFSSRPAQAEGRYGRALRLDGSTVGTARVPGLSERSARMVAFWVRIPANADLSESGPVISWALSGGDPRPFALGWNRDPAAGLLGALRARAGRRSLLGATPLRDGRWHHLAAILIPAPRNDSAYQLKTYIDGRLEAPSARLISKRRAVGRNLRPEPISGDLDTLYVGGEPAGGRFRGDLDELVLADRPLSPREIATLFRENRIPGPELLAAE